MNRTQLIEAYKELSVNHFFLYYQHKLKEKYTELCQVVANATNTGDTMDNVRVLQGKAQSYKMILDFPQDLIQNIKEAKEDN